MPPAERPGGMPQDRLFWFTRRVAGEVEGVAADVGAQFGGIVDDEADAEAGEVLRRRLQVGDLGGRASRTRWRWGTRHMASG